MIQKQLKEIAMHAKDTGSSEVQVALLTEKIETLSKHIKKFKKDQKSLDLLVFFFIIFIIILSRL